MNNSDHTRDSPYEDKKKEKEKEREKKEKERGIRGKETGKSEEDRTNSKQMHLLKCS